MKQGTATGNILVNTATGNTDKNFNTMTVGSDDLEIACAAPAMCCRSLMHIPCPRALLFHSFEAHNITKVVLTSAGPPWCSI